MRSSDLPKEGASRPLLLSVSEALALIECPRRWFWRWRLLRVPHRRSPALEGGTLWHLFRHALAVNPPGTDVLSLTQAECDRVADLCEANGFSHDASDLRGIMQMIRAAAPFVKDAYKLDMIAAESPLEFDTRITYRGRRVFLVGTPDRIDRYHGKLLHHQYKTVGKGIDIDRYIEGSRHSWHENLYPFLIEQEYGELPDLFCLDIFRKLKPDSIRSTPEKALRQELVPIDAAVQMEVLADFIEVAKRAIDYDAGDRIPWTNPGLDRGRFGNSLDPYFPVIMGEAEITDDTLYTTAAPRYESSPDEPASQQ